MYGAVGLMGVCSYLIGSIPWGVWVGRIVKNIDIRDSYSGNIGATNVWRILGRFWGFTVFLLDVSKGAIPVVIAKYGLQFDETSCLLVGLCAAGGHAFSIWLVIQDHLEKPGKNRAKGGKIVATALGVIIVVAPQLAVQLAAVWLAVFLFSRMVSFGSILAAQAAILLVFATGDYSLVFQVVILLMALYVTWKHSSNLQRIMRGEEPRVVFFRKKEDGDANI